MENNNQSEIDPKKIENLHRILSVFDTERLTSKDFIGAFKQVIDHVKNTQNLTLAHLKAITKAVDDSVGTIAKGNQSQISELRDEMVSSIREHKQALDVSHTEALSRLETTIANVKDGKDVDEAALTEKILAQIPPQSQPQLGEDFRNALEALQGDDRLDISAIRGVDDFEKKLTTGPSVIGNNPGIQLADSSGILGRFQTLKFPGATIITSNVDATVTVSGSGTVTSASIVSANGFAGTVATSTTTPAITLSTSVTGVLKGNGTAMSAAVSNTDYQAPISLTTTGTSGAATFNGTTLNIPQYSVGGGSGITRSVNSISTPTTGAAAASTDYVYLVSGTTTFTLPTAIGNTNLYTVKNVGSGTVTVATTSAQTIDGGSTAVLTASLQGSIDFISDAANWAVV